MAVMENFSTRLKMLREGEGLNQSQLAEKLQISRGSISFYENGDRIPDIEFLYRTAKYFKVSFDFLLGENEGLSETASQLSLSREAIEKIIELSKMKMYPEEDASYADLLNALLLNSHFIKTLAIIADIIKGENGIARGVLSEMSRKFGFFDEKQIDARKINESIVHTYISKVIDDLRKNPIALEKEAEEHG